MEVISILRTAEGGKDITYLPTDFSVIRDETTERLITAPSEAIAIIAQLEIVALSPDPTLPQELPYHGYDTFTSRHYPRYR